MSDYQPFYMIWCEGRSAPTAKHMSEDSAGNEAERLAKANPGKTFHVLKSFASCTKHDVEWRGDVPNYLPF